MGYRFSSYHPATKARIEVNRTGEGEPWRVYCTKHDTAILVVEFATAVERSHEPAAWCDGCDAHLNPVVGPVAQAEPKSDELRRLHRRLMRRYEEE